MRLHNLALPFALLLFLTANTAFAAFDVVAKVNGKELTSFELNEEFQSILPMAGDFHGGVSMGKMAEIREQAMSNLIEKELQYQYALEKGITISKKELDAEFSKIEKKFPTSRKFKDALKQSSLTKEELKGFLKKRLLTAKVKEIEVTSQAKYSEADVKDYYEKNKASYKRPIQFKASHILIKVDPSATKDDKEKSLNLAKELIARIKNGEEFEDLAVKYSDDKGSGSIGGMIGTFHKGTADPEFEKAMLSLKVGEISDAVETLYGYHIIKLTGIQPETQLTYDDVGASIKSKLEKKKGEELYQNLINDLRSKAKIEIVKK